MQRLREDPNAVIGGFGLPRTPDTEAVADKVVAHFKAEATPAPKRAFVRSGAGLGGRAVVGHIALSFAPNAKPC